MVLKGTLVEDTYDDEDTEVVILDVTGANPSQVGGAAAANKRTIAIELDDLIIQLWGRGSLQEGLQRSVIIGQ